MGHGDDAGGGSDDVDRVAFAAVGADGVPVCVECADGDGDAGAEAEGFGPLGGEVSGELVAGEVVAAELGADAGEEGVDGDEELFGRQAVPLGVPHPLVAHGADGAAARAGSVMPQSVAATMSQCSRAVTKRSRLPGLWRSQCSSLAKPHSWE